MKRYNTIYKKHLADEDSVECKYSELDQYLLEACEDPKKEGFDLYTNLVEVLTYERQWMKWKAMKLNRIMCLCYFIFLIFFYYSIFLLFICELLFICIF